MFLDVTTPIAYAPRTFAVAAQVRDFVQAHARRLGVRRPGARPSLHAMTYEGVPCERDTIRTGAYPAQRPLGVVTRGRPRGALARFLRWVGTSRKAREVIASRYLPIRPLRSLPSPASAAR